MTVELPRAELELVMSALEHVGRSLPEDPSRSLFAKAADALLQMARDTLTGRSDSGSITDTHQIVVHVEATALSGKGGESDLPLPTVKRLCCDGGVVAITKGEHNEVLDVGRKQRTVPVAIRRALFARDRGCTFPGCHHARYLDAHHVLHWANGGETSLENLLTLCSTHHTLVHEGGFSIQRHRAGRFYFVRPDGRPVEVAPPSSAEGVGQERATYRVSTQCVRRTTKARFMVGCVSPARCCCSRERSSSDRTLS
jgi:hypothetical protein